MGYRGKVTEQNAARDLRAAGWTYSEICAELNVSKASVSLWCRDVEIDGVAWERRARENHRRGNARARQRGPNRLQLAKQTQIETLLAEGLVRIGRLGEREFLVAGAALYAGEGSKTDGSVKFPNSDPRMVLFFLTWLRRFYEIDESRLRVRLYLHDGLDLEAASAFWSELTGIPRSQFHQPYRAVADSSIRKAKHPMGCPTVDYGCSRTHRSIIGLVQALLTCDLSIPG